MRVLITGGNGFVGKYAVSRMQEMDWEVIRPSLDVSNSGRWLYLDGANKIDAVVHLAALLMIDGHKPEDYFRVNTLGTSNALEFAKRNKIPKFIYAMTHSDTNRCSNTYITDDEVQAYGTNSFENNAIPFIASKIAAADMVDAYTRQGILHGVNLRLANIRGYGSQDTKFNSFFHQFIAKAQKGEEIEVWGNPPKTQRDMVYVKDVVEAIIRAIKYPDVEGWYNIGSGIGMTIKEEIESIISVFSSLGRKSKIRLRPDKEEIRTKSCIFLIDKAKKDFGWEPKYSYRAGLKDMKKHMEKT